MKKWEAVFSILLCATLVLLIAWKVKKNDSPIHDVRVSNTNFDNKKKDSKVTIISRDNLAKFKYSVEEKNDKILIHMVLPCVFGSTQPANVSILTTYGMFEFEESDYNVGKKMYEKTMTITKLDTPNLILSVLGIIAFDSDGNTHIISDIGLKNHFPSSIVKNVNTEYADFSKYYYEYEGSDPKDKIRDINLSDKRNLIDQKSKDNSDRFINYKYELKDAEAMSITFSKDCSFEDRVCVYVIDGDDHPILCGFGKDFAGKTIPVKGNKLKLAIDVRGDNKGTSLKIDSIASITKEVYQQEKSKFENDIIK